MHLLLDRIEIRRAIPLSIILVLAFDPAAIGDPFYQLAVASLTVVCPYTGDTPST